MNAEETVTNVVNQTIIELKKFNNLKLNGNYLMLNSKFTGLIKPNNNEIILIQANNKITHFKSQVEFNTAYPMPKIEFFLPEPYISFFRKLN